MGQFDKHTFQVANSNACWILSVLEDLRFQGYIKKMFDKDVKYTYTDYEDDSRQYFWETTAGYKGDFWKFTPVRPRWQQVIESIFNTKRLGGSDHPAKFQTDMAAAMGL